ncbi:type II toxin-antitoxin system VapB family antitoxin [Janibacter cremeus]|uniref:type II toxin-antitoxin system VapB family antitoxin n=1 Tax=Janibacter cremeus TaxID=1285192 RepID=UPI0023F9D850|nr:type II toxin-antitoxin system VapB family antitoxin [Janibacter cremeus]WEV77310.1 type II toxin-antitoxin system VapB family antitoxin [Janibacter cremeus]
MGLNIKNERVHALARQVAQRTGATQTSAIEEALERRLHDLDAHDREAARRRRLMRLMDEIDATTTDEQRAATRQVQDEMYDDNGLPA